MPLNPEQVLYDRYRIDQVISQGGFGRVYRAWDLRLNNPCAIKESLLESPAMARLFTHEAMLLARLNHPNLPRVYDSFDLPGVGQYLVMEFIEGRDLGEMIEAANGALPYDEALTWIDQVLDALVFLHSRTPAIIHRDVKPDNIKINQDGRAILVDFGIAKVFDPQLHTHTSQRALSPGYAPLEQYGAGPTDARSDIYSAGATLYAMLTGQHPTESVRRAQGVSLPSAASLNPIIPGEVDAVLVRALEMQPGSRFQSAAEFRAALSTSRDRTLPGPRPMVPWQDKPAQPSDPGDLSKTQPVKRAQPAKRKAAGLTTPVLLIILAILPAIFCLGVYGWVNYPDWNISLFNRSVTWNRAGSIPSATPTHTQPSPQADLPVTQPTHSPEISTTSVYSDEFAGSLNPRWSWSNPDPRFWSLTRFPGYLSLDAQSGDLWGKCNSVTNLLLQDAPPGDFTLETCLEIRITAGFQQAGLIVYHDDDNYLKFDALRSGPPVGENVELVIENNGASPPWNNLSTNLDGPIYLKLVRQGTFYRGLFSSDGNSWQIVSTIQSGLFRQPRIGLYAFASYANPTLCSGANTNFRVNFDYFRVTPTSNP